MSTGLISKGENMSKPVKQVKQEKQAKKDLSKSKKLSDQAGFEISVKGSRATLNVTDLEDLVRIWESLE